MEKPVGIGIIGTGFARRVQVPAFLSCEGVRIVSVASGSIENARVTAEECGAAHFTADWRETIGHDDVDLVCVTTPPIYHRDMSLAAIAQNKHILCEKPMAMNVAEAAEMTAAAEGYGRLALIDHELRFQPGRLVAHKMLRNGVIGTIRHAKAIFQAPHRGDPNLSWNWWSDVESGGGALGAINSHVIDSLNWLLGADITSVSCQLQTIIKERRDSAGVMRPVTTDDEANMLLRFADSDLTSDATGIVSVSMTESPRYQNSTVIYGDKGAMRIRHRGEIAVALAGETDWKDVEVEIGQPLPGIPDTGFARAFVDFAPVIVDAIRGGQHEIAGAATFVDGLEIQRILDAARESDSTGRRIDIKR